MRFLGAMLDFDGFEGDYGLDIAFGVDLYEWESLVLWLRLGTLGEYWIVGL